MSEQPPLDLRGLADVDSPEVVRAALKTFRRRLWTRYVWVGLAIVFAAAAFVWGGQPSDLREEIEASHLRSLPEQVWRVGGTSVALEEAADLGDYMGLHFVVLPDPGKNAPGIWVNGQVSSMWGYTVFDTYVKVPKDQTGRLEVTLGSASCLPDCPKGETFVIDLRQLMVTPDVWRAEG